jgi:hypothetical protein
MKRRDECLFKDLINQSLLLSANGEALTVSISGCWCEELWKKDANTGTPTTA